MAPSVAQLEASEIKENIQQNSTSTTNGDHVPAPNEPAELNASLLEVTLTDNPKTVPPWNSAEHMTQRSCTDHMITCAWTESTGWAPPELKPYGPLSLMPTASALQYATTCFEGLKAYRGHDGGLRLFRPQLNCLRMQTSAARIALPAPPPSQLLKLMTALIAQDGARWLPPATHKGTFLYVRPTLIGSDPSMGVQKPKEALLYIILSLMAPINEVPGGLRLLASEADTVRAWPGGFGYAKVGANYGPTLVAQGAARKLGFQQVLWLLPGQNGELSVTEAGASNFFVVWKAKDTGMVEVVTAPLGNKIILDGITRRSLIALCKERLPDVEVVEREYDMREILEAAEEGRLIEAFAAGTAYFVSPVSEISFQEQSLKIGMGKKGDGVYAELLKTWLYEIMYGGVQHEWGYVIEE